MWSWILEGIGLVGALLVGRKLWWAWFLLAINSTLWAVYGFNTKQYGFCLAGFIYAPVYLRNLFKWRPKR